MSEQSTPQKPKPGSLRDRIAAFEKPAASPAAGSPPAPRPKPGGISWKPRPPSPPSSPSSVAASTEKKAGGMLATDAKESIGKGGSLKERMAALQNRGGFGAPPPIAPKPALEKPKWKPPPVILPVDKDVDDEPSRAESSKSPPPVRKLSVDKPADEGNEEEPSPAAQGEDQPEADPEEEERQRRAAIAARMARLGGARVGMAPVYGRKPAAKKAESVDEPAKESAQEKEEVRSLKDVTPLSTTDDITVASPPLDKAPEEPPSGKASMPARKNSESSSLLSLESESQQTRSSPTSMPLPSAPRRAVPPRRKAVKSPEIPASAVVAEQLAASPEAVPSLDALGFVDASAVLVESAKKASEGDLEKEVGEVDKDEVEPPVAVTSPDDTAVTAIDFAKKESTTGTAPDDENIVDEEDSGSIVDKRTVEPQAAEEPYDITPSLPSSNVPEDAETYDEEETQVMPPEQEASDKEDLPLNVEENTEEPDTQVADEPEEDEETARRQRIAEKLAKMGGVNPFAPPPQRTLSSSSEDAQTSPTLSKRASISRDSFSSPPPPPQRRQSTRKSSMDSSTVPEGATAQASDSSLTKSPVVRPPSRKNTAESSSEITSESLSRNNDSWQVSRDAEANAPTGIPEETEYSDIEEVSSTGEPVEYEGSETNEDQLMGLASDIEPVPPPPPPIPNLATRPVSVQAVPVDPALLADPVPLPAVGTATFPSRSLPPPPRRLVPQREREEAASGSEGSYSPALRASPSPSQEPSDYEDDEPPRRLPPRSVPNEETTEHESSPLPVPNRRSSELNDRGRAGSDASSRRPLRSIPAPPTLQAPVSDVEQDSDYEEALPTRPRHRPMTPGTPTTNEIPLIVPPPTSDDLSKKVEPSPLRHSSYPAPEQTVLVAAHTSSGEISPSHLSPPLSVSDQEILDDEEGDPIDPSFHSPSRRTSTINLSTTSPPPPQPTQESEEDEQAARRRTIAERMAKLSGIKFGAAPSMRPTPPRPREEEEIGPTEEQTVEEEEEEEERARKERIAAKLAGMGGMRIGMLPLGVGAVRPQASRVQTEETTHPPSSRAVPPSRAPPPPQSHDSDADPENSLSASQHSLSTSDEGVKVEAEESEIEEVSYADAQQPDEELEEVPPPVPVRGLRRRGTGSETEHTSPTRPPVPTSLPSRRTSVQTIASTARKSSADSSYSVQKPSTYKPQSEYVMVEEPSGFVPDEEVSQPLPPARPSNRPPARGVPQPPPPPVPTDSISSWELPSIPSSALEFGGTGDLSLSWPEDSNPAPSSLTSPPPPPPPEKLPAQQAPGPDLQLSPDDLMAVWGRVGVQVCEAATTLFDKSKKSLVGDGTYEGFVHAVLNEVPNVALPSSPGSYGYVVYTQTGNSVQKRVSEIMPGDVLVLQDAKLKGHKGLQTYHQTVGVGEQLVGIVVEFEPKKSKVRLLQANQHVGQQTVEAVSYRLEDMKSGTVKVYRVLES